MSIDWYDRCQAAEVELLLLRDEIERLRAALHAIGYDFETVEKEGAAAFARRALANEQERWDEEAAPNSFEVPQE